VMRDDMVTPWISPLTNGGVQLSWTSGDLEIEAVFDHARSDWELMVSDGSHDHEVPIGGEAVMFFRTTLADRLTSSDPVAA